ncbi:3-demethylubiquinone-9 3-methyltransferase [Listeria weihenstephanensis FSL R9-0317]|uniref:Glyoxalase n=1 Tax=Listeria weihenstephanensis TaxID=1006155 RepID=A0A1S7FTC3_9LIST|nr:VOC family protein [Listeria weihenstephanensis]AQY50691.1 glyoxalase [Listeria weihenstephanensis]EUJ36223.1 3-demethylubiquinone-9 3-methyltransferase [Listeria weihenstephanensis FSL R9-0317]MBC1499562.1 VOC family protein [Listeria weihenstephanensis]
MALGIYINMKNEARDALSFYGEIFGSTCTDLMTYGSIHDENGPEMDAKTKELVMNASLEIEGDKVMFSDTPDFMEFIPGNNVTLVLEVTDADKLTRYFDALSDGATKIMPLQKTFWSEKFGQLTDKYGVGWSFNLV